MRNIYAHIGLQKTGSSAFQRLIISNEESLHKARLLWPRSGAAGPSHQSLFMTKDTSHIGSLRTELETEISPVISCAAGYRASDLIVDGLGKLGRLKPLIFVRNPTDWVNSFYNQLIKAHRVPWHLIRDFSIDNSEITNGLNFEPHLERWAAQCWEASDVRAVPFDHSIDFQKVFYDWTQCDLEHPQQTSNPNPAADIQSLRILIRVKQVMSGASREDLAGVMNTAHSMLRKQWVDTRQHAAPMFISEMEQQTLRERYQEAHQRIFLKYGRGPDQPTEFEVRRQTASRNELMSCTEEDKQIAQEILERS